jgi:hypothetical protein
MVGLDFGVLLMNLRSIDQVYRSFLIILYLQTCSYVKRRLRMNERRIFLYCNTVSRWGKSELNMTKDNCSILPGRLKG